MGNNTFNISDEMIKNLKSFEGNNKLEFCQNLSTSCDEKNYIRRNGFLHFQDNAFCRNARGFGKIFL